MYKKSLNNVKFTAFMGNIYSKLNENTHVVLSEH